MMSHYAIDELIARWKSRLSNRRVYLTALRAAAEPERWVAACRIGLR